MRMKDQTETSIVTWKPWRDVDHAAAERVLGREGDRVDEEVEPAPLDGDPVEDGQLFDRHSGGASPTETGKVFLERARFDHS